MSTACSSKRAPAALTLGAPDSPGVPEAYSELTHVLPYNDIGALEACFAANGANTACVIIEPVAGNMNCVPAQAEALSRLRTLCDEFGAVLIFDEVMSGFRVALGGAQSIYGIKPDLTTLGKVIGGGLPVGAFGGRREIMARIAPEGPVYQGWHIGRQSAGGRGPGWQRSKRFRRRVSSHHCRNGLKPC